MPTQDWRPTLDEIGTRLIARTLSRVGGKREGTFNDSTLPTGVQVSEMIDDAVATVSASSGTEVDEEYWPMLRTAAILYTCMAVEASLAPESTQQTDSAYASYRERFIQQVEFIEKALDQKRPNERRILSLRTRSVVGGLGGGRLDPFANELTP